MRALMWFREDLRISDNMALYHATKESTDGVVGLFFLMPSLWKKQGLGPNKINFMVRNLNELSKALKSKNIALLIRCVTSVKEINHSIIKIMAQYKIDSLYFNLTYTDLQYGVDQKALERGLKKQHKKMFFFHDAVMLSPHAVLNKQNHCYTIFTPFKKRFIEKLKSIKPDILPAPAKQPKMLAKPSAVDAKHLSDVIQSQWPAGGKNAHQRLNQFLGCHILEYKKNRDYPALEGTSKLSAYLSCGIISSRTCLLKAIRTNHGKISGGNANISTWISELIWRDFYKHLLFAYPRLNYHEPFKVYTDKIKWKTNQMHFNRWKTGNTGFPLVDAAMRQLNTTGWMHNRLRMVASSFLTKLLFIDWRLGEAYFANKLIDYDFSANNGGWQWSASTGADSVPYFRIFNPQLQQEKYDRDNRFIDQYCPEYKKKKPPLLIDYKQSKDYALKVFKKLNH